MPTALELQIRSELMRYVVGELSLEEFTETFIPALWAAAEGDDSATAALAAEIDLFLIEHDNGDWTDEQLQGLFAPLAFQRSSPYSSAAKTERWGESGVRNALGSGVLTGGFSQSDRVQNLFAGRQLEAAHG